jgi:hypothetical protein
VQQQMRLFARPLHLLLLCQALADTALMADLTYRVAIAAAVLLR